MHKRNDGFSEELAGWIHSKVINAVNQNLRSLGPWQWGASDKSSSSTRRAEISSTFNFFTPHGQLFQSSFENYEFRSNFLYRCIYVQILTIQI